MENTRNLFGIANSTVLIIGVVLPAGAVLVRTLVHGSFVVQKIRVLDHLPFSMKINSPLVLFKIYS